MTSGVLAADDGCVWLIDEGEQGEPLEPDVALLWPVGYSFDTTMQQIIDPARGRVFGQDCHGTTG